MHVLTPDHFLIGRPLEALPDPSFSYRSLSLLRRWHLCQNPVRQFWIRWKQEYLASLRRHSKWHKPIHKICRLVMLWWYMMRPYFLPRQIVPNFPGEDGLVRVVEVKTQVGTFRRPRLLRLHWYCRIASPAWAFSGHLTLDVYRTISLLLCASRYCCKTLGRSRLRSNRFCACSMYVNIIIIVESKSVWVLE